MKLADYLFRHRLTPRHLQKVLGVSSRSTVQRYLTNQRVPEPQHLDRIEQWTQDQVRLRDFLDATPPECAGFYIDKRGKRRMVLPWSTRDHRLDRAFETMLAEPREGAIDPPPIRQALLVLGDRVVRTKDLFMIDGQPTDTRGLIRAANDQLYLHFKPPIRYPGVQPSFGKPRRGQP